VNTTGRETDSYPFGAAEKLQLHPRYAELRQDEPLLRVRMPFGGEAWLATRHEDTKTVLGDPRFSRAATVGKDVPRTVPVISAGSTLLDKDPPEHSRLRRIATKAFTVRRIEELRPRTQAVVDELLDRMVESGPTADLAASLAWPLPISVICDLLGVPFADRESFRGWTDAALGLGADQVDAIVSARQHLGEYIAGLIAQRRVRPAEDLLTALVAARDNEDRLSEEELVQLGMTLLVAGHETTANQIGNFVYTLLSQPEYWAQLVADPELVPAAVEELLRWVPLGTSGGGGGVRVATEDVELGGQIVRAGEAVVVVMSSANRDEAVFDHSEEIDFSREGNAHIAFGHGAHHCLGAPLARMELQLAIGTLVRRLPTLRLAVPADEVPWRSQRVVRGVLALPVSW
jgi:cytochrome P450 RapN